MALSLSEESQCVVMCVISCHERKKRNGISRFGVPDLLQPTIYDGTPHVRNYSRAYRVHSVYTAAPVETHKELDTVIVVAQRCPSPRVISSRRTTAFWESGAPPARRRFQSELKHIIRFIVPQVGGTTIRKYKTRSFINVNIKTILTFPNRTAYLVYRAASTPIIVVLPVCCLLLPVGACILRKHPQTYCALRCTWSLHFASSCTGSTLLTPNMSRLVRTLYIIESAACTYVVHAPPTPVLVSFLCNRTERASTPNAVPIM